jgi:hypothetical protein
MISSDLRHTAQARHVPRAYACSQHIGTPTVLTCTFSIKARSARTQCMAVARAPPHPGTKPGVQPASNAANARSATRELYSSLCSATAANNSELVSLGFGVLQVVQPTQHSVAYTR